MKKGSLEIPDETLADFCKRWQITELAVFGSALREDFRPESDVDFLVTYAPDKKYEPWAYFPEREELERLLHRKIDWIERKAIEKSRNALLRRRILNSAEVIYGSR